MEPDSLVRLMKRFCYVRPTGRYCKVVRASLVRRSSDEKKKVGYQGILSDWHAGGACNRTEAETRLGMVTDARLFMSKNSTTPRGRMPRVGRYQWGGVNHRTDGMNIPMVNVKFHVEPNLLATACDGVTLTLRTSGLHCSVTSHCLWVRKIAGVSEESYLPWVFLKAVAMGCIGAWASPRVLE